jgi:choline-sulfatase
VATFSSVAAVTAVIAAVAGLWLRSRPPRFVRGERDLVSPVLKPADLGDRKFFLVDNRYLLRLDSSQPSLVWKFDRPQQGRLSVEFFAYPGAKPVPPLRFVVTLTNSRGREKNIVFDAWRRPRSDSIKRHYERSVDVPAGARVEFAAISDAGWDGFDAGMTVPSLETPASGPRPGSVLIISIDALRSDYLGVYQALAGRPPEQSFSPELDRLAGSSVVFLNARTTQSATWPALSSLHLSEYTREHGVTRNREFLETSGDSIATMLRGRGYDTLELAANGESLNIPGFEVKRRFLSDDRLIDFARKRITAKSAAPFFHWYHLWGVHDPYAPPEWVMNKLESTNPDYHYQLYSTDQMMRGSTPVGPQEVEAVRRLYGGALFNVDFLLKALFDDLKQAGLWDETMIMVTADHGEELYDHNAYFYHNPSLYDSAVKIPLLIKFPHQRAQRVIEENVSLIDIFPTFLDYFCGPPAPGRFSGISLLELLRGRREPFRDRILMVETEDSRVVAAIRGHYKLIYNPQGLLPHNRLGLPFPIETLEFYDLQSDPGEKHNLAGSGHAALRPLLVAADAFLGADQGRKIEPGRGKVEITDAQKKEAEDRLRSLGYIR